MLNCWTHLCMKGAEIRKTSLTSTFSRQHLLNMLQKCLLGWVWTNPTFFVWGMFKAFLQRNYCKEKGCQLIWFYWDILILQTTLVDLGETKTPRITFYSCKPWIATCNNSFDSSFCEKIDQAKLGCPKKITRCEAFQVAYIQFGFLMVGHTDKAFFSVLSSWLGEVENSMPKCWITWTTAPPRTYSRTLGCTRTNHRSEKVHKRKKANT